MNPEMDPTRDALALPNGLRARTFTPRPEGFNPLTASDNELLAYGYPARPTDAAWLERWERGVVRPRTYVTPTFRPISDRPSNSQPRPLANTNTTLNWSGAIVQSPQGGISIVGAVTNVPNPYPVQYNNTWFYSSSWIGIGGWLEDNILQVGVEHDASFQSNALDTSVFAWWSWNSFPIAIQFPIAPGDRMNWVICVSTKTFASATIFLLNESSGASTSFVVYSPNGAPIGGTSAEWIVSSGTYQGEVQQLANYGAVYFDDAVSSAGNAGTGSLIEMVNQSNTVISKAVFDTPTLVECTFGSN